MVSMKDVASYHNDTNASQSTVKSTSSCSAYLSKLLDKDKPFSNAPLYSILRVRKGFYQLPLYAKCLHLVLLLILGLSLVNLCLSTLPQMHAENRQSIFTIDLFCCSVFAFEFIVCFYAAPTYRKLFTWMYLIDFLSFFPFVVECLVNAITFSGWVGYAKFAATLEGSTYFSAFRVLRLFRLFRCFRYFQMSSKFRLMARALKNSISGISILVLVMPFMILFFSTLVYFAEISGMNLVDDVWYYSDGTRSLYQTISDCFWVVILTLTTLGYSQEPPRTVAARLILSTCMITSIFLVAFPVTMITIQYQQAVRHFALQQRRKKSEKDFKLQSENRPILRTSVMKIHRRKRASSPSPPSSALQSHSAIDGFDENQDTMSFFNFNDPYEDVSNSPREKETSDDIRDVNDQQEQGPISIPNSHVASPNHIIDMEPSAPSHTPHASKSPLFTLFQTNPPTKPPTLKIPAKRSTTAPASAQHTVQRSSPLFSPKVKQAKSADALCSSKYHGRTLAQHTQSDQNDAHFTIRTKSQLLAANKTHGVTGGVSTHSHGCDILEMERELVLALGGRWPEKVVLRLRRWWLTTESILQHKPSDVSSSLLDTCPVDPDVLVLELDLRNEDDLRRFVGTIATF